VTLLITIPCHNVLTQSHFYTQHINIWLYDADDDNDDYDGNIIRSHFRESILVKIYDSVATLRKCETTAQQTSAAYIANSCNIYFLISPNERSPKSLNFHKIIGSDLKIYMNFVLCVLRLLSLTLASSFLLVFRGLLLFCVNMKEYSTQKKHYHK
jgi:hypothetical protein